MNIDFENNGYLVVRNFFSEETIDILSTYFDLKYRVIQSDSSLRQKYSAPSQDAANGLVFSDDYLTESILLLYGDKMSKVLELDLVPTYTYARIYEQGNNLNPHRDRPSCEISATCPITISDNRASTIYISKFKFDPFIHLDMYQDSGEIKKLGDYTRVDLLPGDVLFYEGWERHHWREPLESDYLVQFFMHTVQINGQFKDFVFDKRPYMGFPFRA